MTLRAAAVAPALGCVLAPAAVTATPDSPINQGDFAGVVGIGHGRTLYVMFTQPKLIVDQVRRVVRVVRRGQK